MSGTTTRLGLPYPGPTDGPDGADVPYWAQALAEAIDGAALYDQGILADRPTSTAGSPGIAGRFYYVLGDSTTANNGILWLDYGTGWVSLNSAGTLEDVLANLPAANTVPAGTRFFATDQVAEYLGNGTSWARLSVPAGVTSICLLATADAGHILLQGQAWPSTSGIYADLYAKFGGATLPDFRQLVPVGFKSGDVDFGTLLGTGGEKKHTLTVNEINHHHTVPTHVDFPEGSTPNQPAVGNTSGPILDLPIGHNNLQPFIVVNYQAKL
jgi:hypothetical protein